MRACLSMSERRLRVSWPVSMKTLGNAFLATRARSSAFAVPGGDGELQILPKEPPRYLTLGRRAPSFPLLSIFTNGRLVGAIPTCSHVRCVGLSGDGPALVPRGGRVFLREV